MAMSHTRAFELLYEARSEVEKLEDALKRIARKDFNDIPTHMEGDAAAEIAERALARAEWPSYRDVHGILKPE